MKMIDISKAARPLSDYANELDDEMVVVTVNNKPVAALVSLKNIDDESLALSCNSDFINIIEAARREFQTGKTVSFEEMRRSALD